ELLAEMNGRDITSGFLFLRYRFASLRNPPRFYTLPRSSFRFPTRLGALLDLEFFLGRKVNAMDCVCGGDFCDGVGVELVGSKREIFSERDFKLVGVLFQIEMLIADCSGAAGRVHG